MKQEFRKTSELKLWEDNPRNIKPKDFERLKKQIQELGQYKPLLITGDGTVIGGNMRLRAYMDLGIQDIWVSVVNPKDDNQMLAYALSDNDRAGYYDDDLLANLSSAYPDFEWGNYAVDLQPPTTLDDLFKTEVEEDETPEVDETSEPVSKLGEVYQLGRHRLMCGDSTKIEDVEKLMNGQKADMVFTDPPYGVDYNGGVETPREKLIGDGNTNLYEPCCQMAFMFSESNAPLYIWHAGVKGISAAAAAAAAAAGYEIRAEIIWNKNHAQFGALSAQYKQKHEPCFYCFKRGQSARWVGPTNEVTVWDIDRANVNDLHPTQKPVALAARAVKNHDCMKILDLFGGSGSTLVACEQLDRTCYMMELDPKYCDVIRKRYAKFIGKEETWEEVSPRVMQADQQSTQTS